MFIVLIGSVARRDFLKDSDIDICRIGCTDEVNKLSKWPNGPISYIDYSEDVFWQLYDSGSLFMYHILYEGVLIKGNSELWNQYKENFIFKNAYIKELENIYNIASVFKEIDIFGGMYLTLYSNLFTLVKNFSIFYLATKNKYIFNKEKAVKLVFGDFYFQMLISAYNYYYRGVVTDNWDYNCSGTVEQVVNYYLSKMEGYIND